MSKRRVVVSSRVSPVVSLSTVVERVTALKATICDAYGCENVNLMIAGALLLYMIYNKVFPTKRDAKCGTATKECVT